MMEFLYDLKTRPPNHVIKKVTIGAAPTCLSFYKCTAGSLLPKMFCSWFGNFIMHKNNEVASKPTLTKPELGIGDDKVKA